MIKRLAIIIFTVFLILFSAIFYLSIFGVKTNKFNNQITNSILKIDKRINLNLSDIHYLLNPYNFTINIKTKNPQILLEGRSLGINKIQTNVALKSLINDQFKIDNMEIITKEIKLNDVIALVRVFQNSPQLFILDTIIKDGLVIANINLSFDEKGKVKKNYKIEGSVKKVKLNIFNQVKLKNLNFNYSIDNKTYSLKQINTRINNTKITSPLIEIKKDKSLFFVKGHILNDQKNFDIEELNFIFSNLPKNVDIQKVRFSSKNKFSFNINQRLKVDNIDVESVIELDQLIFNKKNLKLKPYFPNFKEKIKLEEHNIVINYKKNKFKIKGEGKILLEEKSDNLSYQITKDKKHISFNSRINLKNNSLILDLLDFEKREGLNSLVSIKGDFKNNNQLSFNLINLKEKNNEISIKGLVLNESFKIIDLENFEVNYKNNKKILNSLNLKKDNSNFIIEGDSFDASKIINIIMDTDEEKSTIFNNLNSKIKKKKKKVYIDETNYINNLYGNISYNNNKIKNLKLESIFPNKKKINLFIETKNNSEIITRLFSAYPKPLIKRYNFVKGFEDGYLDFYSSKKGGISNSVLVIDNFKVKEVPVFAKLLSLASLQGIADLLTGEGIRFTDFEMNFSSQKGLIAIEELYAIGPAVSILLDGYIEKNKLVSLRGTLVPATTINRSIASIPLLGKILIGDKVGEGVFGVSFKIKGAPKKLKTTVNPIKTLTPRFITRTLEKIKKN